MENSDNFDRVLFNDVVKYDVLSYVISIKGLLEFCATNVRKFWGGKNIECVGYFAKIAISLKLTPSFRCISTYACDVFFSAYT